MSLLLSYLRRKWGQKGVGIWGKGLWEKMSWKGIKLLMGEEREICHRLFSLCYLYQPRQKWRKKWFDIWPQNKSLSFWWRKMIWYYYSFRLEWHFHVFQTCDFLLLLISIFRVLSLFFPLVFSIPSNFDTYIHAVNGRHVMCMYVEWHMFVKGNRNECLLVFSSPLLHFFLSFFTSSFLLYKT